LKPIIRCAKTKMLMLLFADGILEWKTMNTNT
jgi:hypothetical protein